MGSRQQRQAGLYRLRIDCGGVVQEEVSLLRHQHRAGVEPIDVLLS